MASNYLTRGNSTDFGKIKVYVVCNDDKNLSRLQELILEQYNCVVINGNPEIIGDCQLVFYNIINNIEEMDVDKEILIARENNIPTIPVLFEELQINSEIQYIDFSTKYKIFKNKEEIKRFIDNYVVSEAKIKEIEAAFDISAFLSYRRRDKFLLKKLIKSLRKRKLLYNMSLWFDDFLKPGENYNKDIEEKLLASDLFILCLTENIFEEDNYVLKYEIPAAIENNKEIIIVDMDNSVNNLKTNKLTENIKDYPIFSYFNIHELNGILMTKILKKIVRNGKIHTNYNREYLMGCGYIKGVAVEKNIDIGIEKLEKAGENGILYALYELKKIYREGIGVKINVKKSIFWYEKFLELFIDYYGDNDVSNYHKQQISSELYRVGEFSKLNKYFLTPVSSFDNYETESILLMQKGDYLFNKRDYKGALKFYLQAEEIRGNILENVKTLDDKRIALDRYCFILSSVARAKSRIPGLIEDAVRVNIYIHNQRKLFYEESVSYENIKNYAISLFDLGVSLILTWDKNIMEQARFYITESINFFNDALSEEYDLRIDYNLSGNYKCIALSYYYEKNYNDAKIFILKSIEILYRHYSREDNSNTLIQLMSNYQILITILIRLEKISEAKEEMRVIEEFLDNSRYIIYPEHYIYELSKHLENNFIDKSIDQLDNIIDIFCGNSDKTEYQIIIK